MNDLEQAARQALEALIWTTGSTDFGKFGHAHEGALKLLFPAITALRQALEQKKQEQYTYTSTQATTCAECGKHKHTPLRIDAMGGYVCLTCIDKKLGSLLGEFGHSGQPKQEPVAWLDEDSNLIYRHNTHKTDDYHGLKRTTPLYTEPPQRNPLTRDQALKIVAANPDAMTAIRMTEAAHGIKGDA